MDNIHIRCPKCNWEPDGQPHWQCSCGMIWNTFATGGRCPRCAKVWEDTMCVGDAGGCNKWSPHLDWYENLDNVVKEVEEVIKQPAPAL
jgi:hypothetical protein